MRQVIKIISGLAVVLATAVAFDCVMGWMADKLLLDKVYSKTQYSMTARTDADIVVVGSSRASHHYDTPFMIDSLGIKAYNAGQDGRGLTFHLPLLQTYLRHNDPKVVVLELLPSIDGSWNDRISMLFPLCDISDDISKEAAVIDPFYPLYLKSNLYRHNSNLVDEAKAKLRPYDVKSMGFDPIPVDGSRKADPEKPVDNVSIPDHIEMKALVDIIRLCKDKNIDLVAMISPVYGEVAVSPALMEVLRREHVMLMDNRKLDLGGDPARYFNDGMHMNALGAREYTKRVAKQLRDSLRILGR